MNPSVMSLEEIKGVLKSQYGYDDSQLQGKTKKALSIALKSELNEEGRTNSGFFATIETEAPIIGIGVAEGPKEVEQKKILIGSPEWEAYVLSQLAPNEVEVKDNKTYPKAAGLRRVAQNLLGAFVDSGPVQIFPPVDGGPGRATVVYEIKIQWKYDNPATILMKISETTSHQ